MKRVSLLLLALAGAATYAWAQQEPDPRSLVRLEVSDEACLRACELRKQGASADELRKIQVHQNGVLIVSGVAISPTGEIVTIALHPRARLRINVTFHDGTVQRGKLVGTDPRSHIALVRVPVETPHYLELDERAAERSQLLRIAGHARAKPVDVQGRVAQVRMVVSLQDLYRVNEGRPLRLGRVFVVATPRGGANPGSACVDDDGRLLGLLVDRMPPLVTRDKAYEMNFVLPASRIVRIVRDLREHGRVIRAQFGFQMVPVTRAVREHFADLPKSASSIVKVEPDSPAARAGVRVHDVILTLDGESFQDIAELGEALTDKQPKSTVRLGVLRDGERIALTVVPD